MRAARQARLAALWALVGGALALAACGEDDGADTTIAGITADAPTEAESFRAALDQTCLESAIAVNEVADGEIPRGFRDSADYQAGRAQVAQIQAEEAAALTPPPELEADHERYLQTLEEYADAYDEVAAGADAGDRRGTQDALDRLGAIGNEQIAAAVELDLTACARRLSSVQDLAVREIAERVLTGADPEASCDEDVSEQLKKNNVGRGDRCVESLGQLAADGASIEYLLSTGVDGVLASANVNISTVAGEPPKYLVYDFVWDEQAERWLMDSAFEPGTPAPGAEPPPGESSGA